MDDPDRIQPGRKIEPYGKRQPSPGRFASRVHSLDPDDSPDGSGLFHSDFADAAGVILLAEEPLCLVGGTVFADCDETAVSADFMPVDSQRIDQIRTAARDAALEGPRGDLNGIGRFLHLHRRIRGAGRTCGDCQRRRQPGVGSDREAGPLEGTVGPEGERPALSGHGLPVGCPNGDGCAGRHRAPRPRYTPANARGQGGGVFPKPGYCRRWDAGRWNRLSICGRAPGARGEEKAKGQT